VRLPQAAEWNSLTLILHKARIGILLVLAISVLSPAAFSSTSPAHRQKAIETFERAERRRDTLESQPEKERKKEEFLKLIHEYIEVYRLNPAYSKTPVALTAVAELYEELGRQLSSETYYLKSVKAYQFVISEYPYNRLSRDAAFTIGEVYRADLDDQQAAREAYQKYLDSFPRGEKAQEARKHLAELSEAANVTRREETAEAEPQVAQPTSQSQNSVPEVTAVRKWVGNNYTRIVIGVENEVKFETIRLSNPDRIVLDLQGTHLSTALAGKTFPVENTFLRQIRVGQFKPDVTRVVLDVEKIEDYSVFSLPNPFRLVIDIHGTSAENEEKESVAEAKPVQPGEPTASAKTTQEKSASKRSEPVETARVIAPPAPSTSRAKTEARHAESTLKTEAEKAPAPARREKGEDENKTHEKSGGRTEKKTEIAPASTEESATSAKVKKDENAAAAKSTEPSGEKESAVDEDAADNADNIRPGANTLTRALGLKIGRIVIDPGHGGHDTGTIGPTGLREKDVVLDVGLRLRKLLEKNLGSEVFMTRSDDTFIPLEERTAIANEKNADLFISIHANASRDRNARGIETYYLNFTSNPDALEVAARENATSQESVHQLQDLIKKIALTEKIEESRHFARLVQNSVYTDLEKDTGNLRNRGIKKAPFVVLIGANMPSILAEISFVSNPRDEKLLRKGSYRQKIAQALYDGILKYVATLGGVKVAEKATTAPPPPVEKASAAANGRNL
jgi:N-acetylmuramoyl-L-alanine amidase